MYTSCHKSVLCILHIHMHACLYMRVHAHTYRKPAFTVHELERAEKDSAPCFILFIYSFIYLYSDTCIQWNPDEAEICLYCKMSVVPRMQRKKSPVINGNCVTQNWKARTIFLWKIFNLMSIFCFHMILFSPRLSTLCSGLHLIHPYHCQPSFHL